MARTPGAFKQTDVTRAIKGALAAGLNVTACEITRDGRIVVMSGQAQPAPANAVDQWLEANNARQA